MKIWTPNAQDVANSNLSRFMHLVQNRYPTVNLSTYSELYQWSIDHPDLFWPEVMTFGQIIIHSPWTQVMTPQDGLPPVRWFEGCTLNYAQNLLRHYGDREALVFLDENAKRATLTFHQLRTQVAQLAATLRQFGVVAGDRIAGYCPNQIETVIAMLATTTLGAIWSSCSMDFGAHGAFERFEQIKPKVLFAGNGHQYNSIAHPATHKLKELLEKLTSVQHVVIVHNIDLTQDDDLSILRESCGNTKLHHFHDCLPNSVRAEDLQFTQVPFNHPLFIMFSSGTTGVPKCIVHGAGTTLLQHIKEHLLHGNLTTNDTIFYFTTCGWMMWNWLISSLALGARVLLYDGAPIPKNNPNHLIDFIDQEHISAFGISAKYLTALEKSGAYPLQTHNLSSLKVIYSTGSPLVAQNYQYVYQRIKQDVRLSSISGGTDIISCFALGNPNLPVYEGELQCRGLGMKVEIFNDQGASVRGEKGELVCTLPFPSMPVCFWNDPDGKKYFNAYFKRFAGVWAHGDYAKLTEHDGIIIYGRSDTLLNPGGVRIGTAEIYRAVEKIDEVLESIAIGYPTADHDEQIVLFVVLKANYLLTDELKARIKEHIKTTASSHHVPKIIHQVPDIPRTLSGKIVELAVRNVVLGKRVENVDALANPQALRHFENILQS